MLVISMSVTLMQLFAHSSNINYTPTTSSEELQKHKQIELNANLCPSIFEIYDPDLTCAASAR